MISLASRCTDPKSLLTQGCANSLDHDGLEPVPADGSMDGGMAEPVSVARVEVPITDTQPEGNRWAVVLDTNAWVSDFGLRTGTGAALIHTLRLRDGVIGFPEVVELELRPKLIALGEAAAERVRRSLDDIQKVLGHRPDPEMPSKDDLAGAISDWLSNLESLLVRVRITEDMAREAVGMAVERKAPSQKREELRDSLILLAALELGREYRVVFVTADGDFYQDGATHPDIVARAEAAGVRMEFVHTTRECLRILGAGKKDLIDLGKVESAVAAALRAELRPEVETHDLMLDEELDARVEIFATEDPHRLALTFAVTYSIAPLHTSESDARLVGLDELSPHLGEWGTIVSEGSAWYRPDSEEIGQLHIDQNSYEVENSLGLVQQFTTFRESVTTPSRRVPLNVRYGLIWESS